MDVLYPFVCHHILVDGRLNVGVDHTREGSVCSLASPSGQEIARFGQRTDSLSALLQGAESKLRYWYETKGVDENTLSRPKHYDNALSYKLRYTIDFIRDQGKVEFGDQRGLCCSLRTIHGHAVWHGGSKHMGLNSLLWEVEKQLTHHYHRVGWQCRASEEEMILKRKPSPASPPIVHVPQSLPKLMPSLPSTQKPQPVEPEDKEMQELFKQLQHLQQLQQIQQQQYMQQQQHMYQLFFDQMQRQQQQQQHLFQQVLQVLILQQNLQPSEAKIAVDRTEIPPLSPPSEPASAQSIQKKPKK